ncbi:MAG: lysine--tRNA ligase [Anaerolineae bacterium]|nr:lysine--tRNA ligase [Anaerolineae bacterium]
MAVLYWADQIIADLDADEVILNDSKTYSGSAHVGSLRGPVIHNMIYRAALDAGRKATLLYGSDDYDALDAVPPSLSHDLYQPYLGKPLCVIPAPDGSDRSYAEYFYDEFMAVQHALGIFPTPYRMSDLYRSGRMNGVIKTVLENAAEIRAIYLEVSNSDREDSWFPFNPICENCGRIAMTRVYRFDGEKVYYRCERDAMDYAQGCGHEGAVSPFDGHGKLPWKLEWAARWQVLGVNVEGAGMDHSVEGGSRDVAEAVARRVFKAEPPANIPYEFLLLEGGKMSSSKGIGFSAKEVSEALPAELLRYLLVRTRPRTAINFNLDKDSVPRLYDEFDTAAENYFKETNEPDENWQKRIFELSQIERDAPLLPYYRPRFMHVVTVSQIPGVDSLKHFEAHKGAPLLLEEASEIQKRIAYTRVWLERFAPESAIFVVQDAVPHAARSLTGEQRGFLTGLIDWYRKQDAPNGEQIHKAIYDIATGLGLKPGQAFQVIYRAFLGRTSGPRAGELLAALPPDFVVRRLQQVESIQYLAAASFRIEERRQDAVYGQTLTIQSEVLAQFPELRIGVALVRSVQVHAQDDALDALKAKTAEELTQRYQGINLGSLDRIKAYRELYRAFGVDPGKRNPSAEALLRRITRGGLPTINTVVDAYNLTSAETLIPMAAYDASRLSFPVELRFARSGEVLEPLGDEAAQPIEAGELVYADQARVICLDFNYRDADYTKITLDTQDILLLVDGCGIIPVDEVQDALELAASRIIHHSGGTLAFSAILYLDA